VVSGTFASDLNEPIGIAVFDSNVFVTTLGDGAITEFNDAGDVVNSGSFPTGLDEPGGIVVVPEPSILGMLVAGLCLLIAAGRRNRRVAATGTPIPAFF
jgi:hypothetical protein